MEEADQILFAALERIGILAENHGIHSLNGYLNSNNFIGGVHTLLEIIGGQPGDMNKFLDDIPVGKKYKLCMNLTRQLQSLGYSNELGYNTFFYPKISDIRSIFSFLLQLVPKSLINDHQSIEDPIQMKTPKELLMDQIRRLFIECTTGTKVSNQLKPTWLSMHKSTSKNKSQIKEQLYIDNLMVDSTSILKQYSPDRIDSCFREYKDKMIRMEIIEKNESDVLDEFIHNVQTALKRLETCRLQISTLQQEIETYSEIDDFRKYYKSDNQILFKELQQAVEEAKNRCKQLEHDWQEYRQPFVEQLNALVKSNMFQVISKRLLHDKYSIINETELKGEIEKRKSQIETMSKHLQKRNVPNRREIQNKICALQATINKQQEEIAKITLDISNADMELQKLTVLISKYHNSLPQTSPIEVQIYQKIMVIHQVFQAIINHLSSMGELQNGLRSFEESIYRLEVDERVIERYNQAKQDLELLLKDAK